MTAHGARVFMAMAEEGQARSWDGVTEGDRAPVPHDRWGQAQVQQHNCT